MKGGAKCRKLGGWDWLESLKVIGNVTIQQSTYDFLLTETIHLSCIVFETQQVVC